MRVLLFVATISVFSFLDKQTVVGITGRDLFTNDVDTDCYIPYRRGPCRAYFVRYYYDTGTDMCKQFVYGGCDGNNNNFNTKLECEGKCVIKID